MFPAIVWNKINSVLKICTCNYGKRRLPLKKPKPSVPKPHIPPGKFPLKLPFYQHMTPYRVRVVGDEDFEELYQKKNIMPYGRIKLDWWHEFRSFHKWPKWNVRTDAARRQIVKEHAPMRLRLLAIKENEILPTAIREEVTRKLDGMPNNFDPQILRNNCQVSGRKRGGVRRFRLSRFVFREYADKGKLSGVMRAIW